MSLSPRLSESAANAAADAVCTKADGGLLRIYDGAQPLTPDAPVIGQVLIAECRIGGFTKAKGGVSVCRAIEAGRVRARGPATWFRVLDAAGQVALWDGSAGVAGTNLVLSSAAFDLEHGDVFVSVDALSYAQATKG